MKKRLFEALLIGVGAVALFAMAYRAERIATDSTDLRPDDVWIQNEITIEIPGLTEEKDFLFLTDQHIAIKTMEDLGGAMGSAEARLASFVNVNGLRSADQFPLWVDLANTMNVDGVLLCGDMIDYYSSTNDSYMLGELERLNMPYIYAIGNHERYSPEGVTDFSNSALYAMFQDCDPTFQVLDCGDFVIVAIDDETYQVNEQSFEQFQDFVQTNEKPIILMAHVPFYTENMPDLLEQSVEAWGKPTIIGQGARDITEISYVFIQMLLNENNRVVAVLTGDDHFNYSGMMDDRLPEYVVEPSYTGAGTLIHVVNKDE